jgi:hypothetical protein
MSQLDKLREIVARINEAERIDRSSASAEIKYDTIFGLGIWQDIEAGGYHFEWYNPDTSYEEDAARYLDALRKFKQSLGNLLEEPAHEDP